MKKIKSSSLHIGLNYFDSSKYFGDNGRLRGCVNDAYAMQGLAVDQGFESSVILTNKDATKQNFHLQMEKMVESLSDDGFLLLSFSGHGGQLPSQIEPGENDEVWCMYDGLVSDNQLCHYWTLLPETVKVLVISDSCHSGGIVRVENDEPSSVNLNYTTKPFKYQLLPANSTPKEELSLIKGLETQPSPLWKHCKNGQEIRCSVRLIAACHCDKLAYAGAIHSKFTSALLEVWNGGEFEGNYHEFYLKIMLIMHADRPPIHMLVGGENSAFNQNPPFYL